jgi:hypothetical protein
MLTTVSQFTQSCLKALFGLSVKSVHRTRKQPVSAAAASSQSHVKEIYVNPDKKMR